MSPSKSTFNSSQNSQGDHDVTSEEDRSLSDAPAGSRTGDLVCLRRGRALSDVDVLCDGVKRNVYPRKIKLVERECPILAGKIDSITQQIAELKDISNDMKAQYDSVWRGRVTELQEHLVSRNAYIGTLEGFLEDLRDCNESLIAMFEGWERDWLKEFDTIQSKLRDKDALIELARQSLSQALDTLSESSNDAATNLHDSSSRSNASSSVDVDEEGDHCMSVSDQDQEQSEDEVLPGSEYTEQQETASAAPKPNHDECTSMERPDYSASLKSNKHAYGPHRVNLATFESRLAELEQQVGNIQHEHYRSRSEFRE